jgi:hypothetical protein
MNIMMNSNTNLMDLDTRRSSIVSSISTLNMNEHDQAILKSIIDSNNVVGNDIRTIAPTIAPTNTNTTMNAPTNANASASASANVDTNGNSNIYKTTTSNNESSEVLEAKIRKKSKHLKDLVANFWVPPSNGSNNTTTCTTASFNKTKSNESINALKKQLRKKKSEEAMFGMFHPVDIDNKNTTTMQQNSKWINALEGRKASIMTGQSLFAIEKQLFQSSSSNSNNNNTNNYNTVIPPTTIAARLSAAVSTSCDDNNNNNNNNNGGGNNVLPPATPIPTFSTCSNNHYSSSSVVDEPSPYDIVCGRNSGAYNYIGNRRFRVTVEMHLQRYIDSPTREDKTNVIKSIVWMLHEDIGARFLKKTLVKKNDKTGRPKGPRYEVMNEKQAREKVGHALRDLVIQARKDNLSEQLQQQLEQQS